MERFRTDAKRGAREIIEHRPDELLMAVNGFVLASINVSSSHTQCTQSISIGEKIAFVEVFSSQGVRLMYMDVEAPPEGNPQQTAEVRLSDGRILTAALNFESSWPVLRVSYVDPSAQLVPEAVPETGAAKANHQRSARAIDTRVAAIPFAISAGTWSAVSSKFRRFSLIAGLGLAVPLIIFLIVNFSIHRVSAADLLSDSAQAEQTVSNNPNVVVHRAVYVEELHPKTEKTVGLWKIESWQSAKFGVAVWRLANAKDQVVASEFRRENGASTFYRAGLSKTSSFVAAKHPDHFIMPEDFALLVPTAEGFPLVDAGSAPLEIEETPSDYVVNYSGGASRAQDAVVRASLGLDRRTHHAHAQTLFAWVAESDAPDEAPELREFRSTETAYQLLAPEAVSYSVFQPGAEAAPKATATAPPRAEASTQQELTVFDLLLRVNEEFGEALSLARTSKGTLVIRGTVETVAREAEIRRALGAFPNDPYVQIAISAAPPDSAERRAQANPIVQDVVITQQTIPVDYELRAYLSRGSSVPKDELDHRVSLFADEALDRSGQVRSESRELSQLIERFPLTRMQTMDPTARAELRRIVKSHAKNLQASLTMLDDELAPAFTTVSAQTELTVPDISVLQDADLIHAVDRLQQACATVDDAINRSFTLMVGPDSLAPVDSTAFWDTLRSATQLATSLGAMKLPGDAPAAPR